jgi:methionine-gamma-lyase
MDRHCTNAMQVAEFLAAHEKISHVNYPGLTSHASHDVAKKQMKAFGGMLSFEIQGGMEAGINFMNKIQFCTLAPTLGDVDSLIVHPASSSHLNIKKEIREAAGISDGMVRLSVGIESVEDIIYDLEQALG